ncbi:MAG: hypothetical protein EZS28_023198 [Streblomastix strix]|uniref:Uncharacterized protein n=1 Tax=Streblomastix strix TaxID=222440 RepID=A0A5J4VFZ5_9EUKA|nr:MAG: hypothetical protein EZS28_023198 [Streblomastix strix]
MKPSNWVYVKIHIKYKREKLENNDQNARHITFGLCVLEKQESTTENTYVEFNNLDEFIRKQHKNLIAQHHSGRKVGRRPYKDIHLKVMKFQHDFGACKVFVKTLNVGNKIACARLVVSSVLGLTPGCDIDAPHIYLLGIYLNIHVHALGIKLPPAVEAQAKYVYLYLEPVRNEIQLHFLDKTV